VKDVEDLGKQNMHADRVGKETKFKVSAAKVKAN
jgi:hypothetical protein